MALLTQIEYARHRKECELDGGTHTAVQRALDSARIAYEPNSKLIDPDKADKDWLANTEPRPSSKTSKPQTKNTDAAPSGAPDYKTSRTQREFYDCELARLKVEEKQGKLIPATVVQRVLYEAGRIIRAGHEDIVAQLAPDLASETNINAVEKILKARLDRLDNDLADRIANLDQTTLDTSTEDIE